MRQRQSTWASVLSELKYILLLSFLLGAYILADGCSSKRKERKLQKFDSVSWIQDKNGCDGIRLTMKDDILKSKYRMRGMKAGEIEALLGKPDAQELYKRNQRYYIYFIDPGPDCTTVKNDESLALFVRFSAMGIASEFTFRNM
jgi:hypothetical protein